jgi:hypothetical protein
MEIHATPEQLKKYAEMAVEISNMFFEAGFGRNEGLDALALVIVCMMVGAEVEPKEAHAMADALAECIKNNYDLRRRDFEPLN